MMRSVKRTLAIFESFTAARPSLTLQEIANQIELPKSTTFRIVQSLDKAGYLIRLENQEYCLSFRFTKLAGLVKSTLDIRQIARPLMLQLAEEVGETITLNTLRGHYRVCLDVVETSSLLRSNTSPGAQVRLVNGATAKVLMAYMPEKDLDRALNYAAKMAKRTKAHYLAELKTIRAKEVAVAHDERAIGLTGVSAPIRDVSGEVKYCISIAGPTARMRPATETYVKAVTRVAKDISRRLGSPVSGGADGKAKPAR
jgi:DNA-binding IclR family transcriptional regulator